MSEPFLDLAVAPRRLDFPTGYEGMLMGLDTKPAVFALLRSIQASGGSLAIPVLRSHAGYDDPADYLEEAVEKGLIILEPGTSGPAVFSITASGRKALGVRKRSTLFRICRIAWQRHLHQWIPRY